MGGSWGMGGNGKDMAKETSQNAFKIT